MALDVKSVLLMIYNNSINKLLTLINYYIRLNLSVIYNYNKEI